MLLCWPPFCARLISPRKTFTVLGANFMLKYATVFDKDKMVVGFSRLLDGATACK